MIKSSDKGKNNSYRILKVLANQDYLAVNYQHQQFIFSQIRPTINNPNNHTHTKTIFNFNDNHQKSCSKYLLKHEECINIDKMSYLVFPVGSGHILWAKMLEDNKKKNMSWVFRLFNQAVNTILYNLLWFNHRQAQLYLDIKNFWVIDGQMYMLMLRRNKLPKFSIKKSQRHSSLPGNSSATQIIISHELETMKIFAMMMWEILQEQEWKKSKHNYDNNNVVLCLLAEMIKKNISFEELQTKINEVELKIKQIYPKREKHKPRAIIDLRQRRNTQLVCRQESSYIKLSDISRMKRVYTQAVSTVNPHQQINKLISKPLKGLSKQSKNNSFQKKYQTISTESNQYFQNDHQLTRKYKRIYSRMKQSLTQSLRHGTEKNNSNSLLKDKFRKEGELARSKYKHLINFKRKEQEKGVNDQQDVDLTSKLIEKLNKYKERERKKSQLTKQSIHIRQLQTPHRQFRSILVESIPSEIESRLSTTKKTLEIQSVIKHTVQAQSKNNQSIKQQVKPQLQKSKQLPIQVKQHIIPTSTLLKKSDLYQDSQIETIAFDKRITESQKQRQLQRQKMKPSKVLLQSYNKLQMPIVDVTSFEQIDKIQKLTPEVNEIITLYNILGDITVKAIKNKNELTQIDWKKSIFFIYDRFAYERSQMLEKMERKQPFWLRQSLQISKEEWSAWYQSLQCQELLQTLRKQNPVIMATLSKISTKLLEENKIQKKIEHYIRNHEALQRRLGNGMRRQLTKIGVIYTINDYDFMVEKKIKSPVMVEYIRNCLFGLKIIAELDGMLTGAARVKVKNYRSEIVQFNKVSNEVEGLYDLYFPQSQKQL